MIKPAILSLGLLLASCGPGSNDPGPGGVSVEDAKALDAAAEKLDAQTIVPVMQAPPAKPTAPQDKTIPKQ